MGKLLNNVNFSSNLDMFIVKRIIKRVDIHIASVQCKNWSNLNCYALKNPIFSKKIISDTEDDRINSYKICIESLFVIVCVVRREVF